MYTAAQVSCFATLICISYAGFVQKQHQTAVSANGNVAAIDRQSSFDNGEMKEGNPQKVAFLFVCNSWDKFVVTSSIWTTFFNRDDANKYSMYFHFATASGNEQDQAFVKDHDAKIIQHVPSNPDEKGVRASNLEIQVELLREALKDPDNIQFLFVSDSSLPLKDFNYVYHQLTKGPRQSRFCLASAEQNDGVDRCSYVDKFGFQLEVPRHHQWNVLSRDHASLIVDKVQIGIDQFEKYTDLKPGITGLGVVDEYAQLATILSAGKESKTFTNMTSMLGELYVEQKCYTFEAFSNCFERTEFTTENAQKNEPKLVHTDGDDSLAFPRMCKDYLEKLTQQGFMFLRKIDDDFTIEDTEESISTFLPQLWAKVDRFKSEALVWTRLDVNGVPAVASTGIYVNVHGREEPSETDEREDSPPSPPPADADVEQPTGGDSPPATVEQPTSGDSPIATVEVTATSGSIVRRAFNAI